MKIEVTQEDIDNGKCCNSEKCPIALAVKRKFPDAYVVVDEMTVSVGNYIGPKIDLPDEASMFIHNFDGGELVKPFSFELPEK